MKKLNNKSIVCFLIMLGICFACTDISYGMIKEKVKVIKGHYFSYNNAPLILIGDSGTQSLMQNINVDYRAWIDDLDSKGIKSAMIWSWMAVRQKSDGSIVDKRFGYVVPDITPWSRSGNGVASDGKSLWNLHEFDTRYWARLEDLVRYAESKGIVMVITVFDGWPKDFWSHPFNSLNNGPIPQETTTVPKIFTRKWLKKIFMRTNSSDGREQFWTLHNYGDEVLQLEYDERWPWELKNQYFQERFAEKLIETTSDFSNVIYELVNEGSNNDKYDQHWIDFFAKRCDNLIIINDDYTPLDGRRNPRVDAMSWHTQKRDSIYDINRRWVRGFRDNPPKPVINSETVPAYYDDSRSTDVFRKIIWSTVAAGGNIFVQDDTVFAFDPLSPQKPKGDILRDYIGYANLFINKSGVEIMQMEPLNNTITSGRGFVLGLIGTEYIIYFPEKNTVTIDLTDSSGYYKCKWFDPSSGIFSDRFTIRGGSSAEFSPPFPDDSVLHIKKQGE